MTRKPKPTVSPRYCEAGVCGKPTQGGKPFCPDHLFSNAYARKVFAVNEAVERDAEGAKTKTPEELDVTGVIATEILRTLSQDGQKTIEKIAQDVNYLDSEGAERYAIALERAGLVKVGRTSRGAMTLKLL